MKNRLWLVFILITVVTWGVWGAFSGYQIQNGIPDTVVYIVWALSMIPCAIAALIINKGKFMYNKKAALLGCTVGLLGAGGQLVLFKATLGYEYIVDKAIWLMILLIQEVEKKKKILIIRKDMKY